MNAITELKDTGDTGIPDALRRAPTTETKKASAIASVAAKSPAIKAATTKPAKVKAEPKTGKVVKAAHKPSEVTATEQNPQKSIVPVRFKAKYAEHGDSNGDRVALALKAATTTKNDDGRPAVDLAALKAIAEANGIDMAAYSKLNVGMQRMNIGNRLRGMLKNEKPVTIGKQRFADWEKAKIVAPATPKAEKPAKAA